MPCSIVDNQDMFKHNMDVAKVDARQCSVFITTTRRWCRCINVVTL
jgi:hypothetical protein